MLDIFSGLRLVIKRRHTSIDNAIFRCHWFLTSTILISFSLIITARQYVGQPIECHSTDNIPDTMLNSYCWVQSTFTIPTSCSNKHQIGIDVPYPCVDNKKVDSYIKVFAYYQWVGIVLFIQGVLFHLPYYLWKVWESGLIKAITGGLRTPVLSEAERSKKQKIVIDYIYEHLGCHKKYAIKYFICELCCLLNLIIQLYATNRFFDGQFLSYGFDVMQYMQASSSSLLYSPASSPYSTRYSSLSTINLMKNETVSAKTNLTISNHTIQNKSLVVDNKSSTNIKYDSIDPMTYIFPRMTKCTYFDFGSSGDVQRHDALCLLPLNIVNEKIYIALWFWFLTLAMLTIFVILYRICAFVSPSVRCKGLASRCKFSTDKEIGIICAACDIGDWFLLYMVAENLDPLIMREIVTAVAYRIQSDVVNEEKKSIQFVADVCHGKEQDDGQMVKINMQESKLINPPMSRRSSCAEPICSFSPPATSADKFRKRLYSRRLNSVDLVAIRQEYLANNQQANSLMNKNSSSLQGEIETSNKAIQDTNAELTVACQVTERRRNSYTPGTTSNTRYSDNNKKRRAFVRQESINETNDGELEETTNDAVISLNDNANRLPQDDHTNDKIMSVV